MSGKIGSVILLQALWDDKALVSVRRIDAHACESQSPVLQSYIPFGTKAFAEQELLSVVSIRYDSYSVLALPQSALLTRRQTLGSVSDAH